MKLRYIRNLMYYDGPLTDLFIDDGLSLYISMAIMDKEWHYIVRKVDEQVTTGEPLGINWPSGKGGFFDTATDAEFFIIKYADLIETKDWDEKFPYWTIEARPITDEERIKYADDSPYWRSDECSW